MEIKLNNINFTYKKIGYKFKRIFNNLNLNIKTGEITGIIGENKTTLLELINKTLLPDSGTILLNDKELNNIGFSHQNPIEHFINTTVKEELLASIIINNKQVEEIDKKISDALIMVNLNNTYLNRKTNSLSSSELKKLSLACTLITNPKIILLDDPTYSLDLKDKQNLIKLIKLLKKRYNKTFIIATNDTEFLNVISDYIYVINKDVILEGTKYNVFKEYSILNELNIRQPRTIEFSSIVLNKKNIKIGYRDEINDLIKDIYRYK